MSSSNFSAASSTPSSAATSSAHSRVHQHGYTHSFPSYKSTTTTVATARNQGLSPATRALAKQALNPSTDFPQGSDRTMLFFGGLQWLLDNTVENARTPSFIDERPARKSLTEDAVRQFDRIEGTKRIIEEEDSRAMQGSGTQRTNAWIADQTSAT